MVQCDGLDSGRGKLDKPVAMIYLNIKIYPKQYPEGGNADG